MERLLKAARKSKRKGIIRKKKGSEKELSERREDNLTKYNV